MGVGVSGTGVKVAAGWGVGVGGSRVASGVKVGVGVRVGSAVGVYTGDGLQAAVVSRRSTTKVISTLFIILLLSTKALFALLTR